VLLREGGRQELYEVIFPRFKPLSLHLVSEHAERGRPVFKIEAERALMNSLHSESNRRYRYSRTTLKKR
jgi:hypothetical protein